MLSLIYKTLKKRVAMKWTMITVLLLTISGAAATVVKNTDDKLMNKLSTNPKTFKQRHEVIVLVDVQVGQNGKALTVRLSQPKRYTSFNQLALLAAKKRQFPRKELDGQFIEYWLKNVEFKQIVSPMGTQIEPFKIKPALKDNTH
jgi:hypothetical protein